MKKFFKVDMIYQGQEITKIYNGDSIIDIVSIINNEMKPLKPILLNIEEIDTPLEEKLNYFAETIKNKIKKKKLNYYSFYSTMYQLSSLLNAGIDLKDALEDLGNNSDDELLKEILLHSATQINKGENISQSFSKYKEEIGITAIAMLKLAEKTGDLSSVLNNLAQIYEKLYIIKQKFKKAMRYPIIVFTAIIIAFTILMIFVVPKFEGIFKMYKAKLPLPSRILIGMEHLVINYGFYIFIGIGITLFFTIYQYKTSLKFKKKMDYYLLKLPIMGKIIFYSNLTILFTLLTNLVKAGNNIIESLEIIKDSINNEIIKDKVTFIIKNVKSGKKINEAFKESDLLDNLTLRMIDAGEKAGDLSNMLNNIQKYFDEKNNNIIDNLSSYIEPIMLFFIAGMVLLIALGVFLPMWGMGQAVLGHH